MRFFKINPAILALVFSVIAEVLFFFVIHTFGHITEFGTPLNFIGWLGFWFHVLPDAYMPSNLVGILAIPAFLLQWWFMFFVGIVFVRYVSCKNNPKALKIIIATLTIALITSLGFLVHSQLWQNSNWKAEVGSLASIQGYEEADKDFQAGKLKVFVISGECHEDKYSGTNDGPFEVWTAEYYPSFSWPERYSIEEKIEAYNRHMRLKYERSLAHANTIKSSR